MAGQSVISVAAEKPYFSNAFRVSAGTKLPSVRAPKNGLGLTGGGCAFVAGLAAALLAGVLLMIVLFGGRMSQTAPSHAISYIAAFTISYTHRFGE